MLIILLICCLLLPLPSALATGAPDTVPLPAEDMQRFQEKLLPWTDDGAGRLIDHFDAAENGRIALSFQAESGKQRAYVGVYDQHGTFLWGFSYSTRSAAAVELADGGLILHLTERSAMINENGQCTAMFEYADLPKGQAELRVLEATQRKIGQNLYELRLAAPLALGYSTLVRIAPDGTETLLYHRPGAGIGSSVFAIGVVVFIVIALVLAQRKKDDGPTVRRHL